VVYYIYNARKSNFGGMKMFYTKKELTHIFFTHNLPQFRAMAATEAIGLFVFGALVVLA